MYDRKNALANVYYFNVEFTDVFLLFLFLPVSYLVGRMKLFVSIIKDYNI